MKANEAPEKIYVADATFPDYVDFDGSPINTKRIDDHDIEYVRADAFIENALKWYCLDCECNDNCKDIKCFFHNFYKCYLEGDTTSLPPKFSNTILNEDGSTSDNWRYRHFTDKMKNAFIEKACAWFRTLDDKEPPYKTTEEFIEGFRKAMNGE